MNRNLSFINNLSLWFENLVNENNSYLVVVTTNKDFFSKKKILSFATIFFA